MLRTFFEKLKNTPSNLYISYLLIYVPCGITMNLFGIYAEIAQFDSWWQIISCYVIYMIPISILLREKPVFEQYAYGVVAIGILEFSGYAFQTSYAFPNNILDQWFGIRNFALAMTLFFGIYFPLGNWLVTKLYNLIFLKNSVSLNTTEDE